MLDEVVVIEGKIRQFSCSRGAKVGLPNYSSEDVHVSVTVELEHGTMEEFERVFAQAQKVVRAKIGRQVKEIHENA